MNQSSTDNYMLLFRSTDWYAGLSPEEVEKILTKWGAWYQRLTEEGIVEHGRPLGPEVKIVGKDGLVSDGPFAESKESVGGYFMVRAGSFDEAVAVAKGCPGLPYGVRVEVRPVVLICPCAEQAGVDGQSAAMASVS